MRLLHQKVEKLVKPEEDDVRFYWMPTEAASVVLTTGSSQSELPPKYYVL
ncbi:MAG: hypothetical protein MUE44_14775 [Oscillatoriaceae cyanobacterium Prado104]|jgi:CRISPR-associated protein Cas2|nr:hypothetical protein [Oscillatoriaceae cyanobacterium Prado104]